MSDLPAVRNIIIWTEVHGAGKPAFMVSVPSGARLLHYEADLDGPGVTVTLGFVEYGKKVAHIYRGRWESAPARTLSENGMTATTVNRFLGEHIGHFRMSDVEKAWKAE